MVRIRLEGGPQLGAPTGGAHQWLVKRGMPADGDRAASEAPSVLNMLLYLQLGFGTYVVCLQLYIEFLSKTEISISKNQTKSEFDDDMIKGFDEGVF